MPGCDYQVITLHYLPHNIVLIVRMIYSTPPSLRAISFDREEDKLHIASRFFSVLNEGNLHAIYGRQIVNR
jgi:hypothetical protein